jgi:hypothetical protein
MTAVRLADALRDSGLSVSEYDGWENRGSAWSVGIPVGVMVHHTAPPVPFPVGSLVGSQLKANQNVKPDGTIWLLAYRACNYSSGSGSSKVLAEVRAGTPPSANAKERGLSDDTSGNPWFWNIEVDHPGDGSPIPGVQLDALAVSISVVAEYWNLTVGNVCSHAEWTARKSDPYWNHDRRCIDEVRSRISSGGSLLLMTVAQWVENLEPDEVRRLCTKYLPATDPDYWVGLLDDPSSSEWVRFRTSVEVEVWLG